MFNQKINQKNSLTPEEYNKFLEQQWREQEKRQLEQKRLYKENKIQRRQNKKLMKMNQQRQAEQFRLNQAKRQEEEKRLELEQKKRKGQTKRLQENKNLQLQQNARQQAEQRKIEGEERKKQQERLRRQKQLREQEEKQKESERLEFQRKKREQEERLKQLQRIQTQRRLKQQEQKRKELERIQLQRKLKEQSEKRIKQERLEKQRKLKEEEQRRKQLERLEQEKKKKLQEEMINKMKAENEKFKKFVEEQKNTKDKVVKLKNMEIKRDIHIEKTSTGVNKIKVRAKIQNNNSKQKKEQQKTEIPLLDMKSNQIWEQIEKIQQKSSELSHLLCDQVMNQPVTKAQLATSENLKKSLKQKATLNPDSMENVVFRVAEELQKSGVPIIISEHSTIQSQISMKVLTEGFMSNAVKVTQIIPDNDPACPFAFSDLENPEQFDHFCSFYKMKTSKQTGIDPNTIIISSVTKGSIQVEFIIDAGGCLTSKFKIQKFFQNFHLSCEDFDPRGNIEFNETKNDVQTRGGWPYYQPVKCKRYGINVFNKYDSGNNTWLMMAGNPGQWAVAFHAVRTPTSFHPNQPKTLDLIMQGREKGTMLKVFPHDDGQVRRNNIAQNRPNEIVGIGIYCTPHIQQTFMYSNDSDAYALILQCRVNPKQIRVCDNHVYWVIAHPKDIRPYGIILMKQNIKRSYPGTVNQFGKVFRYSDYKLGIQKYTKSY